MGRREALLHRSPDSHRGIRLSSWRALKFKILGRIELSFANKGWFKLLGGSDNTAALYLHYNEVSSQARYLSRLSKSAQLYLRFCDPSDGYTGDSRGSILKRTACKTVIIDWILTIAFANIKHIDNIRLTGTCLNLKRPSGCTPSSSAISLNTRVLLRLSSLTLPASCE